MEISRMKEVKVNAKLLKLHLKLTYQFTASLVDQDGERIFEQDCGYVPSFMPGNHYGDYVILDIDIDTGQITNWKSVTKEDIEEWCKGEDE